MTRIETRRLGKGLMAREQAWLILEHDEFTPSSSDTIGYVRRPQSAAHEIWATAGHILARCEARLLELDQEVIARQKIENGEKCNILECASTETADAAAAATQVEEDRFSERDYLINILACKASAEHEISSNRINYALREAVKLGQLLGEMRITLPHNELFLWGAARRENTVAGSKARRLASSNDRYQIVAKLSVRSLPSEHKVTAWATYLSLINLSQI